MQNIECIHNEKFVPPILHSAFLILNYQRGV